MEKKCVCCGSQNLTEGIVNTSESMRVFFVSTKERKKIFPKAEKIFAFKCKIIQIMPFPENKKSEK